MNEIQIEVIENSVLEGKTMDDGLRVWLKQLPEGSAERLEAEKLVGELEVVEEELEKVRSRERGSNASLFGLGFSLLLFAFIIPIGAAWLFPGNSAASQLIPVSWFMALMIFIVLVAVMLTDRTPQNGLQLTIRKREILYQLETLYRGEKRLRNL